ncbi:MAG: hypothetical protein FWD17_16045, partial [Polyangiaceae bacterium]|nr:hypothetical protein [Polyangiaceae bacterium]
MVEGSAPAGRRTLTRPAGACTKWHNVLGVLGAIATAGCHRAAPTALVVGVQSEPMGGVVSALHVTIRLAGSPVIDEWVRPPHGSRVGFPQPFERTVTSPSGRPDKVEVEVDAINDPAAAPLFERRASTHFIPGRTPLLRVPLESRCIVYPQAPRGASKVPGPLSGPTCTAPATCIMGICQQPDVPMGALESYAPNWPTNAPDRCKPRGGGPPDLQIGTGQSYYRPIAKGQIL